VILARNLGSGALSQLPGPAGCVAPAAYPGCLVARGLTDGTSSVVISPDGRHLYVAGEDFTGAAPHGGTIAAFARDAATGSLTQLPGESGCLTVDGREGCRSARPLGAWPPDLPELAMSPDGRNAYAPFVSARGLSGGIVAFSRDPATGALVRLQGEQGCLSQRRTAGCQRGRALEYPTGIAVSADGRNVYVSASNSAAISAFAREPSGALRQLRGRAGCVGGHQGPPIPGPPGAGPLVPEGCTPAETTREDVALSRDGTYAYGPQDDGIVVFARNGPGIRLRVSRRGCAGAGVRVNIAVFTHGGFREAVVSLDGRVIRETARSRSDFTIATSRLARRRHLLSVVAADARGRRNQRAVRIRGCPSA
jgi:hypothetical protein